jgi:hypothetical protein
MAQIKLLVTLTWSKIMAFMVLIAAVSLDFYNGGATCTMFAIPFISALVLGKQYFDKGRPENK